MDKLEMAKALTYMERWKFIPRDEYVIVGESAFVMAGLKDSAPIIEIVTNQRLWESVEIRFEPSIKKGEQPFNRYINWTQFNVRINNPDYRWKWEFELVDNFRVLSINNYRGTKLYDELTAKKT